MRRLILVGLLATGCGPSNVDGPPTESSTAGTTAEATCRLLAHTPACGETVALEFIDPIGVPPDIREVAIRAAQYHLVWSLGAALTGDMAVYRGTASVRAWGQREVEFELDPSTAVAYPGAGYTFLAEEEEGPDEFRLRQYGAEGKLELRAASSWMNCTGAPLELSKHASRLQGKLTCQDTPQEAEAVLDYERVPSAELSLEEAVAALDMTPRSALSVDSLEPCGAGLVYVGEEVELRDVSVETGTIYVDANVIYYVDPSCPQTIGVARLELIRVERCRCEGHCHGRYDSSCMCIGENYPPDDTRCP